MTTDNINIRIIRDYKEYLYAKAFHSIDEIDEFLESHKLPKLIQEEIKILNKPTTSKKWNQ